jgi:hypothetical protein
VLIAESCVSDWSCIMDRSVSRSVDHRRHLLHSLRVQNPARTDGHDYNVVRTLLFMSYRCTQAKSVSEYSDARPLIAAALLAW